MAPCVEGAAALFTDRQEAVISPQFSGKDRRGTIAERRQKKLFPFPHTRQTDETTERVRDVTLLWSLDLYVNGMVIRDVWE
jgi:hypothetical protein